jgi:hypothetical protein
MTRSRDVNDTSQSTSASVTAGDELDRFLADYQIILAEFDRGSLPLPRETDNAG